MSGGDDEVFEDAISANEEWLKSDSMGWNCVVFKLCADKFTGGGAEIVKFPIESLLLSWWTDNELTKSSDLKLNNESECSNVVEEWVRWLCTSCKDDKDVSSEKSVERPNNFACDHVITGMEQKPSEWLKLSWSIEWTIVAWSIEWTISQGKVNWMTSSRRTQSNA
jgi:hypothetical protein